MEERGRVIISIFSGFLAGMTGTLYFHERLGKTNRREEGSVSVNFILFIIG
jgi:hypothetical protein